MAQKTNGHRKPRERLAAQTKYKTPEDLENGCLRYFEKAQLITTKNVLNFTKNSVQYTFEVSHKKPMSMQELFAELKITGFAWQCWRKERADLAKIIAWAEKTIFEYNVKGVLNRHFPLSVLNNDFYYSKLPKYDGVTLNKKRIPKSDNSRQSAVA